MKSNRAKKTVEKLEKAMAAYKEEISLQLCVSDGNGKIGRIKNISVAPIITCHGICGQCAIHCYDTKAVLQYPEVCDARARNTVLLRYHPFEFFAQALSAARRQQKGLFRWNVGGEIDGLNHLRMIVRIAELVPGTRFLLFTKRHYLVNSYCDSMCRRSAIPSNLKLIFSAWAGMALDNPYSFPVSAPYAGTRPSGWKKCVGNCETCAEKGLGCWSAKSGDVIGFAYHGTDYDSFAADFADWDFPRQDRRGKGREVNAA